MSSVTATQSQSRRLYFDNAASSLPTDVAREAGRWFDEQPWAGSNPNSLHTLGRAAFSCLETARSRLAKSIGARRPSEVFFTSGGTESNNIAILGMALSARERLGSKRNRILLSSIEHESVLGLRGALSRYGFETDTIPVTHSGVLDLDWLRTAMGDDVCLVSCMLLNNELGTVQPVSEVADICHRHGALVHTDAVQALGKIPLDVWELGVDAASITAHKIGGPVGTGALYIKARTPIHPVIAGGGQEGGIRSGTVNVRGAHVFSVAAEDAHRELDQRRAKTLAITQNLISGLVGEQTGIRLACHYDNSYAAHALPEGGIVCLIIPGLDSQRMVLELDERGFAVSGGSACASKSLGPSHVMEAIGLPDDAALSELRISFDHRTSEEDANALVSAIIETLCTHGIIREQ